MSSQIHRSKCDHDVSHSYRVHMSFCKLLKRKPHANNIDLQISTPFFIRNMPIHKKGKQCLMRCIHSANTHWTEIPDFAIHDTDAAVCRIAIKISFSLCVVWYNLFWIVSWLWQYHVLLSSKYCHIITHYNTI